ncbi:transcriptional regulator HexR [Nitrospirillum viridazoti]|uniref:RpiR family transcriptional regulator n=1 Tax=Nitrospirillum amazonense TaxID=28077 RepID=A0A560I604_9PROT|nr:transcriptional regulator HexR [Nitrospirillum amazonense]TWB54387.1 RpiR family transcriptional regulator [Nitrospirillum amazonense]
MLGRIRGMMDSLRPSERKIAEIVLKRPHAVVTASVAEVAREADVSQPTVVRFCRSIGCSGYQDFKLRLAQDLATGTPFVDADLMPDDPVAEVAAKVIGRAISAFSRMRNQLNAENLSRAVDILAAARRIEIYGFGASGIVAQDAQNKFFRLGVPVIAHSDVHVQAMAASILGSDGAVIAISHTGRTRELLRSVDLALDGGASVVAITSGGSPLAERATVPLLVDVDEDTSIYTPRTSRLSHLAVIDVLQVAVALRQGTALGENLARVKRPLRERRMTERV